MSTDMRALRAHVMAMDAHEYDNIAEDTVRVTLTHNLLKAQFWELKFDMHTTVLAIKDRCYKHTGTPVEFQELVLKSGGAVVAALNDDARPFGFYSPAHGMELHVIDTNPHSMARGGGLEDESLVKKYVMSEEDYDKREGTLRDYARKQRAINPDFKFFPKEKPERPDRPDCESKECVEHIDVGARCSITPGARRGTVAFVGEIEGLQTGYWVGVRFDEPVGKGDGTRDGKVIFECEPKHGAFVRPYNVEVGDFPVRDIMDELSDSDSEEEGGAAGAGDAKAPEETAGPVEEAKPSDAAEPAAAAVATEEVAPPASEDAPAEGGGDDEL